MRSLNRGILLAGVVSALLASGPTAAAGRAGAPADVLPAKVYGPNFSLPVPQPGMPDAAAGGSVTEFDLSLGCILGGTTGTALSVGAGGMNVVNLIAGGLVAASSPVAMWVALGGVVFASFCSVGQALTPAAMATYAYFVPPAPPALRDSRSIDARYCLVAQPLTTPSDALRPRSVRLGPEPM